MLIVEAWSDILGLRDILGSFLRLRSLRCDLADTDVDADHVVANIVRSELFCNLGTDVLSDLLGFMDVRRVRAGSTVMRQGERSDLFFVLAAGNAVVTHVEEGQANERILARLAEPTGFGDEALLDAKTHCVTVKMESDGILLRITRNAFADFVAERVVKQISRDDISESDIPNAIWLWVEGKSRRLTVREGTLEIPLCQLRERIIELDRDKHYYCCCHDGRSSAIAAFMLGQRGFDAVSVDNGRYAIANDSV